MGNRFAVFRQNIDKCMKEVKRVLDKYADMTKKFSENVQSSKPSEAIGYLWSLIETAHEVFFSVLETRKCIYGLHPQTIRNTRVTTR